VLVHAELDVALGFFDRPSQLDAVARHGFAVAPTNSIARLQNSGCVSSTFALTELYSQVVRRQTICTIWARKKLKLRPAAHVAKT
jgi:hypothetical protein